MRRHGLDKSKGAGRIGLGTIGGWNKGQRYGHVVSPEEIEEEEKRAPRPYPRSCDCGTCRTCKRRVYQRIWERKQKITEDLDLDARMDEEALKWLNNMKGK